MVRASAWYRCDHDGVLRAARCCPPQAKHHGAQGAPSPTDVRQACCCRITTMAAREASARGAPPIALEVAPAVRGVAVIAMPLPEAEVRVAAIDHPCEARGPPRPLFAQNC